MNTLKNALASATLFRRQGGLLPQTLNLFVTARCNARCPFCLYRHAVDSPTAREREMTAAEYDALARSYGPLHYLAVSGGEPFLRSDLADICSAFIGWCGVKVVDIPSNFFFTEAMVRTMDRLTGDHPEVAFDLQLSLDGVGPAHDASRKVDGLFARARESFAEMARLRAGRPNLRIKSSTLYLPENASALGDLLLELAGLFDLDRMSVSYPQRVLPAGGDPAAARDVEDFDRRAAVALARLAPRRPLDLHVAGMLAVKGLYRRLLREAASGRRPAGTYCQAGRHLLVIDQEGTVYPCEPLWSPLGSLREPGSDIRSILAGPRYAAFRAERLGPGKCNCTWSCAMHSAIAVTPAFLPPLAASGLLILARRLLGRSC